MPVRSSWTAARLRLAGVVGQQLLEVALAVAALVQRQGIVNRVYSLTQLGKVLLRIHVPKAWRETDGCSRSSGRYLRVLGRQVWFYALIIATPEVIATIGNAAQPGVVSAAKSEAKRKARYAVVRRTEDAIARDILRAREWGAGAQDLVRLEDSLRHRYSLGSKRHA